MTVFSANEAKSRFGQLLDAARRDPVVIEKHGRAVAVVLSKEDYDELLNMKLERLRAEVQIGIDAADAGRSTSYDVTQVGRLSAEIKTEARKRRQSSE